MKVNGNHKNGSQHDSKESATDQLSKKAVAVVEEIPLKHFDTSGTWKKLSDRLGQVDKRFVTWGLAMAASFSLLVAANISVFNWGDLDEVQQQKRIVEKIIKKEKLAEIPKKSKPISLLETVKPQTQILEKKSEERINETKNEIRPKTILLRKKIEMEGVNIYPLSNPFVTVFAKANFQSGGVTPEIGLDFKLAENYTAKRRDIYKLGISSQFNFKTNEAGDKKIHPHTFVNLEFTSLNKKTNKGWTTRAGYLLNPDGYLYQDTTIKVSLFRNIGKHVKIGPEVIFTDNLKQAYPSISLVLG